MLKCYIQCLCAIPDESFSLELLNTYSLETVNEIVEIASIPVKFHRELEILLLVEDPRDPRL